MTNRIFWFVFLILCSSRVYADDTTFNYMSQDGCGGQCSNGLYYKALIVTLTPGGSCTDVLIARRTSELAKADYTGGSCIGPVMTANSSCTFGFICVCCAADWVTAKGLREVDKGAAITVTNVDQGNEKTAAEAAFNSFDTSNPYADLTADGYSRTDGFKGYAYTAGMAPDGIKEILAVTTWKRGAYTKGPAYSLESLGGGGGGGGGLSKSDAQDAFTGALTTKGLSNDSLKASMKDAFDYAHNEGYLNGSLTVENYPGVKTSDLAGTFTGGNTSGLHPSDLSTDEKAGIASSFVSAVQTPFSGFMDDMKTTSLYHAVGDFFDAGNISGDSPQDVDIETTYLGTWSFHWDNYAAGFSILRACMLVCFGYASVRIVMRGGSG